MRIHERRSGSDGHAEFFVRDLRSPQRRRDHPRAPAVVGGNVDRDAEHGGLSGSGCALHDHQRIGRGDGSGGDGLPGIESCRGCGLGHVGGFRLPSRCRSGELVA